MPDCPLRKIRPNLLFLVTWAGLSDTSERLPFMTVPPSGLLLLPVTFELRFVYCNVTSSPLSCSTGIQVLEQYTGRISHSLLQQRKVERLHASESILNIPDPVHLDYKHIVILLEG